MEEMLVCDSCGKMYYEPDKQERLKKGTIYTYEETVEVCPFCYSMIGHEHARHLDFNDLTEDLDGVKFKDYQDAINKLWKNA